MLISLMIAIPFFLMTVFGLLTRRNCTEEFQTWIVSAAIFFSLMWTYNKSFDEAEIVVARTPVPKSDIHKYQKDGKAVYFLVEKITDRDKQLVTTNLSKQIPNMTLDTPIVKLKYKEKGFGFDYSGMFTPQYEASPKKIQKEWEL
jgi:hypothetical protein